jgi:hypothetical protein
MIRPSIAQIKAQAQARASQLQARARRAAEDNQGRLEQRINAMTCNGQYPLTKAQIEQLGRESATFLRDRMR